MGKSTTKMIGILFFGLIGIGCIPNFNNYNTANKICVIIFLLIAVLLSVSWWKGLKKQYKGEIEQATKLKAERESMLSAINAGTLTPISTTSILLRAREKTYVEIDASLKVTRQQIVGSKGSGIGVSMKVAKGVYVRSGNNSNKKVYQDITTNYSGVLTITNQRIVFFQTEKGFEIPLAKLSGISSNINELYIQNGNKNYTLSVSNADILEHLIRKLRESAIS